MIVILAVIIVTLLYYYTTKNYSYWFKKGVKHDPPVPLFGNNFKNYFGLASITEVSVELYNRYRGEKAVGFYRGPTPELLIRDPDIIRQILTTDFNSFHRRGIGRDPVKEPIFSNLFHVDGDRWKLLRQRLTPAFTTAKLKAMFPLIVECAEKLQKVAAESASKDVDCDVRDLMARFTTDFIGACGFGIDMDALNDDNSLFRVLGRSIFNLSVFRMFLITIKDLFPNFEKILPPFSTRFKKDLTNIFTKVQEERKGQHSGRNDFVDLLLELEKKGKIVGPSIEKTNADGTPAQAELEMDVKIMVAQLFIFFAAGFETSSSATSYTLHQLAYNQNVQEKVYQEIKLLAKYDNKLSYDA
ncbi:Cytochrome P450 6a2 [Eumeta japonica]|uniref:unspecific monooxygenase n=1 Tax=Eumeta variegata TaxID=151549 RepID=A0A4C1U0K2_EUMVA|nr:Cytochrome P450 6a2 [Eumeta japonica]